MYSQMILNSKSFAHEPSNCVSPVNVENDEPGQTKTNVLNGPTAPRDIKNQENLCVAQESERLMSCTYPSPDSLDTWSKTGAYKLPSPKDDFFGELIFPSSDEELDSIVFEYCQSPINNQAKLDSKLKATLSVNFNEN